MLTSIINQSKQYQGTSSTMEKSQSYGQEWDTYNCKLRPCNSQDFSNILYGFQSCSLEHFEVHELISTVMFFLHSYTDYRLSAQGISNCFYGLQNMSNSGNIRDTDNNTDTSSNNNDSTVTGNRNEVLYELLNVLCDKIEKSLDNSSRNHKIQLKAQHMGNILYGIKMMSVGDCGVVLTTNKTETATGASTPLLSDTRKNRNVFTSRVIPLITTLIHTCDESLDGQELASCIYGLKSLSIGKLLYAYMKEYHGNNLEHNTSTNSTNTNTNTTSNTNTNTTSNTNTNTNSNTDSDIHCMLQDIYTTIHLLEALTLKINASSQPIVLTPQESTMIFYGLQGLSLRKYTSSYSTDTPYTSNTNNTNVNSSSSDNDIVNAVSDRGNQQCSLHQPYHVHRSLTRATSKLIKSLLPSLLTTSEPISYQQAEMCCYGLRNMSTHHKATRSLIDVLVQRIETYGVLYHPNPTATSNPNLNSSDHRSQLRMNIGLHHCSLHLSNVQKLRAQLGLGVVSLRQGGDVYRGWEGSCSSSNSVSNGRAVDNDQYLGNNSNELDDHHIMSGTNLGIQRLRRKP